MFLISASLGAVLPTHFSLELFTSLSSCTSSCEETRETIEKSPALKVLNISIMQKSQMVDIRCLSYRCKVF